MKDDWSWKPPKEEVEARQRTERRLHATKFDRRKKKKKSKKLKRNKAWDFYESREWLNLRYRVLKEHGAKCMLCNATRSNGLRMHVDHIKPRSKHPELELDFDNMQVLCERCNIGKGNTDDSDFRPTIKASDYAELEVIADYIDRGK